MFLGRNTFYNKGFTLIEVLIGTAVFLIIALAGYQAFVSLFKLTSYSQTKIAALNLANEQFEIARNLPYGDVGIVSGIPSGKIPHVQNLTRSGFNFVVTTTIRNIDLPFDGTLGGTPNDTAPADNKLVEVEVACPTCTNFSPITVTSNVAPKNLENASTNGALFIRVFDANGVAVPQAQVTVVQGTGTSTITINDETDNNGMLQLVDIPPGTDAYEITVTKSGYSIDRTYPVSVSNPNPTKRNATVAMQQVTQVSFVIDRVSEVNFSSVTPTCTPVGNFDYTMTGAKQIGNSPVIYKTHKDLQTNGAGIQPVNNVEWDSYTIRPNDSTYDLIGLSPLNQINITPNSTQDVLLVVAPKNSQGLLVTVKDSSTGLPLTDAFVELSGPISLSKYTGQGFVSQTDWSGGGGQQDFVTANQYYSDNGNATTNDSAGEVHLLQTFGEYVTNAVLESSIFDTGSLSNFRQIFVTPVDQPVSAGSDSVRAQIATATTSDVAVWSYKGPDGTSDSFYTPLNTAINSIHNNDRYVRYKLFLSTASSSYTPTVADTSITFTSACTPPGQVFFSNLSTGTYTVDVGRIGYATSSTNVSIENDWTEQSVVLTPQ